MSKWKLLNTRALRQRLVGFLGVSMVLTVASVTAFATDQVLPQLASDKHLGVSTCDSSACHGGAFPSETEHVDMNEKRSKPKFNACFLFSTQPHTTSSG